VLLYAFEEKNNMIRYCWKTICFNILVLFVSLYSLITPITTQAIELVSTTTLTISICGDGIINAGEECDVLGETGEYSTTIDGRQCGTVCQYGPYCGDGILQTVYDETCDDGNNVSDDFCAADCTVEFADSGGGSSGGGGNSSTGGRDTPLGDTQVTVTGKAFPSVTVTILIDGDEVGTVRTNSKGEFTFNTDTDPGTASFSFWANDSRGTRSATVNTTFDVTQGAVTNLNGILIPPTIRTSNTSINPGDSVILTGQTIPSVTVEVSVDNGKTTLTTTSEANGDWSITVPTTGLTLDTHTVKARFISGTGALKNESTYGTALSLFVGVEGRATSNSDLNRDGKVNLIDFSILIFWWGTAGGNSNPPADINQNARVGLEDFSILLFNWSG
jgi:cysteine-rich repeat protein